MHFKLKSGVTIVPIVILCTKVELGWHLDGEKYLSGQLLNIIQITMDQVTRTKAFVAHESA